MYSRFMPPLWMVLRPFISWRVVPHPALSVSVPPSDPPGASAVLSPVLVVGLPAPGTSVATSSVPIPGGAASPIPGGAASPIPGATASPTPGVAPLAPSPDGAFDAVPDDGAMALLGSTLVVLPPEGMGSPWSVPHAKRNVPRP